MEGREKAAVAFSIIFSIIMLAVFNFVVLMNEYLFEAKANIYGSIIIVAVCILFVMLYLRETVGCSIPKVLATIISIAIGVCILGCSSAFIANVIKDYGSNISNDEAAAIFETAIDSPWVLAVSFMPVFAGSIGFMSILGQACDDREVSSLWYYLCYIGGFIIAILLANFLSVSICAFIMLAIIVLSCVADFFIVRNFIITLSD